MAKIIDYILYFCFLLFVGLIFIKLLYLFSIPDFIFQYPVPIESAINYNSLGTKKINAEEVNKGVTLKDFNNFLKDGTNGVVINSLPQLGFLIDYDSDWKVENISSIVFWVSSSTWSNTVPADLVCNIKDINTEFILDSKKDINSVGILVGDNLYDIFSKCSYFVPKSKTISISNLPKMGPDQKIQVALSLKFNFFAPKLSKFSYFLILLISILLPSLLLPVFKNLFVFLKGPNDFITKK